MTPYEKALASFKRKWHQDNCPERGDFVRWYEDRHRAWVKVEALRDKPSPHVLDMNSDAS